MKTLDELRAAFIQCHSGYERGMRGEASPGENAAVQEAFRHFVVGYRRAENIPEGFALVPLVPTGAMRAAWMGATYASFEYRYRTMIDAVNIPTNGS